ncbi:ABC transporter ATP-binding protein [Antarcticibacterium flavum]|uniref:ABC transporter ATP-binding protein n=1 Tax=Antarcticibacterium flavum TaxID=2058175 RepID=A0A5B7X777_9FLAO|nr:MULTISPECIES: ABC transporter ATP-binding protein [Antarcticibacterium]MCM4161408.1 ABC transporter ATP-binding protein [Antarcticibacterium sp. W02-3]QCY70568.1 ABC transporter ATP-binding protein [Antarcticibacterium flavum]
MKENELLVKVEGLSKKFCKDLKTSLWYGVKDLYSNIGGNKNNSLRDKEFWAVKDISFELRRGECLGLIGHNGAGKSTLLKILNGLIKPDTGKVTIKGRVGALIELGAGFNPILSGRENIFNNGAILGFTRREINDKIEEIIDFAELREFIDMPVQNYSSGMTVRLGFAIAVQIEPDVLLIDEVLAVGDMGFVLKCFKSIDRLLPNTALIFVSHNMPMISRLCNQILLLNKGESYYQGKDVAKGIASYYNKFSNNPESIIFTDNSIRFLNSRIINAKKEEEKFLVNWNTQLHLELELENLTLYHLPFITVSFYDKEQREVAIFNYDQKVRALDTGKFKLLFIHPNLQLSKGIYTVNLIIYSSSELKNPMLRINNILSLQIEHPTQSYPPFLLDCKIQMQEF